MKSSPLEILLTFNFSWLKRSFAVDMQALDFAAWVISATISFFLNVMHVSVMMGHRDLYSAFLKFVPLLQNFNGTETMLGNSRSFEWGAIF